jgi:hypothetical protein
MIEREQRKPSAKLRASQCNLRWDAELDGIMDEIKDEYADDEDA